MHQQTSNLHMARYSKGFEGWPVFASRQRFVVPSLMGKHQNPPFSSIKKGIYEGKS